MRPRWLTFVIGWVLVLGGGYLAHRIQTAGGVSVRDVRVPGDEGVELSGLLFVPPEASEATPAPGVLAIHGYINSRETQSAFAIELARRGYVVLALDQTGHGFSGGVALTSGYGGPAALAYLASLPFVDPDRIGLEGHSMGGWAVLSAALAHPDSYRSVTLVGSATGPGYAPAGTTDFPRNLGVVFSRYDEFAGLMWGVDRAADVTGSDKLRAVFGVEEAVLPGRIYGSVADGTARWLATPTATHPGDHLSRAAVGDAVQWLASTIPTRTALAHSDQIWPWKELGTLVALFGGLLVLLGSFDLLLSGARLRPAARPPDGVASPAGPGWWLGLLAAALVPALTYFPATAWGAGLLPGSGWLPQRVTNQVLAWAVVNAVLAGGVVAVVRLRRGPARRDPIETAVGSGVLAALGSVIALYAAVWLSQRLFLTDLRFWVVALKPMAARHVPIFLAYLAPFTLFFYLSQRAFTDTLSLRGASTPVQHAVSAVSTVGGFAAMVLGLHLYLFRTGHLPDFGGVNPLFSVVAIQFVAVLAATSVVSVVMWRRTGSPLPGAVASGMVVTWYVVAGQATHV